MKKIQVFQPTDDMPRERSSLLTMSNKYGLTFVGLHRTFKVYLTLNILAADKADGSSNEVGKNVTLQVCFNILVLMFLWYSFGAETDFDCVLVTGIPALAEVTGDLSLHHLALSCDELTLSVCGTSEEAGVSIMFYDVRTFINKVTT